MTKYCNANMSEGKAAFYTKRVNLCQIVSKSSNTWFWEETPLSGADANKHY